MKENGGRRLTIGALAKAAGVNVQTIRFYERKGLLKPSARLSSGYRLYDAECLKRLNFIIQAKGLGFSLAEAKGLLGLRVRSAGNPDIVREKVEKKLEEVRQKIVRLRQLERTLTRLADDCRDRRVTDHCPIIERMEGPV
ncbi:MAG: heavy metal-responsive transcriptional regulator [Nitrospinae bacterium]|nr:heavy metal-responsive transcriptional regulator [Nitrospinota bacterium]